MICSRSRRRKAGPQYDRFGISQARRHSKRQYRLIVDSDVNFEFDVWHRLDSPARDGGWVLTSIFPAYRSAADRAWLNSAKAAALFDFSPKILRLVARSVEIDTSHPLS